MKSDVFGITWPAIKVNQAAMLAALISEIRETQWLRPDEVRRLQHRQLSSLIAHHAANTPSFAARLEESSLEAEQIVDRQSFGKLRPLTRSHWQDLGEAMFSSKTPAVHGKTNKLTTSGSTGEPVVIHKTMINGLFWAAHSLRDHEWHQRDLDLRMVSIRADVPVDTVSPNWGYPAALLYETGSARGLPINTDIAKQLEIIGEVDPGFLITYPSNLSALVDAWEKDGCALSLRHIKTLGETLSDGLRSRTRSVTGLEIEDGYSSNEAGTIAIHCGHGYHTMDDSLIVEVLDQDGNECEPGEIGRVVLTDLHNFATPVIRYEIGDYAERGTECSCGRGYGTLNRVLGRQRNLICNPDGTRHWPLTGFSGYRDVADIKQYQIIQHDADDIEFKVVTKDLLTSEQEERLIGMVRSAMKHDFNIRLTVLADPIPKGKNGKFEEFICRIP